MKFKKWFKDRVAVVDEIYSELEDYDDFEVLHQYRINLRKLYASSEVYLKEIEKKSSNKLSKLIKKMIKPTSVIRDLDVFLIEIDELECSQYTKDKLHNIFKSKREKAFKKSLYILNSRKYKKRLKSLKSITENSDFFIQDIEKLDNYKIIKNIEKKIYKRFNKINLSSSSIEFHHLRMEFKKFRYGLAIYEKCFKKDKKILCDLSNLKKIQELFGTIQDSYVKLKFISSVKEEFTKEELAELKAHIKVKLKDAKKKLLEMRFF